MVRFEFFPVSMLKMRERRNNIARLARRK